MLILSRKPGERIRIGQDIELIVKSVSGNRVQLGISAPPGVRILRAELEERDWEGELGEPLPTGVCLPRIVAEDPSVSYLI